MGSSLVLAPGYCVCVCVCLWTRLCVRACPGGLHVFFPWRWEQQSDVKESRESSHILSIPLFQSLSRSCYPMHVAVSLLWFSCLMFPLCLQHDTFPSVSLALSLHLLWYFSPQSQQNPSAFSCSGYSALFPLPLCECLLMLVAVCSLLFTGSCSVITCSRSVDLCFMTMCAHGTER